MVKEHWQLWRLITIYNSNSKGSVIINNFMEPVPFNHHDLGSSVPVSTKSSLQSRRKHQKIFLEAGEMTRQLRALIQFPEPTQQHTTVCNSSSRGPGTLTHKTNQEKVLKTIF